MPNRVRGAPDSCGSRVGCDGVEGRTAIRGTWPSWPVPPWPWPQWWEKLRLGGEPPTEEPAKPSRGDELERTYWRMLEDLTDLARSRGRRPRDARRRK